jgi:hypothetical protein
MSCFDALIGQTLSHYRILERLGGGGEPLQLTNDEGEKYRWGCELTRRGRGETKCFGRLSGIPFSS